MIVEMWTEKQLIYGTRPVLDLSKPDGIPVELRLVSSANSRLGG